MNENSNKKETKLLTGFRSDLDNHLYSLLQKQTKVLYVSDTSERNFVNFKLLQKIPDKKVTILQEEDSEFLEVIQKHHITMVSSISITNFLQKENFSLYDFKLLILDDCNDLLNENSIFKVLIEKFKGQIFGVTSNYKTFEIQFQYFENVEDVKSKLQAKVIQINETNLFKPYLIRLMHYFEEITLNFLKNVSLREYPYGTMQYETFLKSLITFALLEDRVNLTYCLYKLLSVNNAILVRFKLI